MTNFIKENMELKERLRDAETVLFEIHVWCDLLELTGCAEADKIIEAFKHYEQKWGTEGMKEDEQRNEG